MLKLSEAIRLGSMETMQAIGAFYSKEADAACALGAALLAVGHLNRDGEDLNHYDEVYACWPEARRRGYGCPSCLHVTPLNPVAEIIIHLNDDHEWTRERIADWVATVENAIPAAAPETPEPVGVTVATP